MGRVARAAAAIGLLAKNYAGACLLTLRLALSHVRSAPSALGTAAWPLPWGRASCGYSGEVGRSAFWWQSHTLLTRTVGKGSHFAPNNQHHRFHLVSWGHRVAEGGLKALPLNNAKRESLHLSRMSTRRCGSHRCRGGFVWVRAATRARARESLRAAGTGSGNCLGRQTERYCCWRYAGLVANFATQCLCAAPVLQSSA